MKRVKKLLKALLNSPLAISLWNFFHIKGSLGKNNCIILSSRFGSGSQIFLNGRENRIHVEKGTSVGKLIININGSRNTIHIAPGCYLANCTIWIEDDGNYVLIDKNTLLCGSIQLSCIEGTSIKIGKDCLFSSGIDIRTGDSHALLSRETGKRINPSSDVVIGDHVWVGRNVSMLKGAHIREGSMVGANTVVTKSFEEDHVVIAGMPGKIVKRDIDWHYDRECGTSKES